MKYDHFGEDQRTLIADRLRSERENRKLSQEKLAEKLLLSKPTINKWEKTNGKNSVPTMDQLVALCDFYSCDIGYLLCEYDSRFHEIADIRQQIPLEDKAIDTLQAFGAMLEDQSSKIYDFDFIDYLICELEPCFSDILQDIKTLRLLFHDRQDLEADVHFNEYEKIAHEIKFAISIGDCSADLYDIRFEAHTRLQRFVKQAISNGDDPDTFCQLVNDNRYERIYEILDGTLEKGLLFSVQDQFLRIVKSYLERQDDHGKD